MNNYELLRAAKIKTRSQLKGLLRHAYREQNTPNADTDLLDQNTSWGAESVQEGMARFEARLETQNKIRKNAVLGIEYLVSGTPEAINEMGRAEQDKYFQGAIDWLKEKHGEENIACYSIHRDENTCPHLHVYVVPIDEKGKLNCRAFLGGTKHRMTELQDEFHEKVGAVAGLDRGVKGSRAKHTEVRDWYKAVNSQTAGVEINSKRQITKKNLFTIEYETDQVFAERIKSETESGLAGQVEAGKLTRIYNNKAVRAQRTNKELSKKVEQFEKAGQGLSQDEITQALSKARREKAMEAAYKKSVQEQQQELEKQKKDARRTMFRKKANQKGHGH